jgi:hypothetical protein
MTHPQHRMPGQWTEADQEMEKITNVGVLIVRIFGGGAFLGTAVVVGRYVGRMLGLW